MFRNIATSKASTAKASTNTPFRIPLKSSRLLGLILLLKAITGNSKLERFKDRSVSLIVRLSLTLQRS